MTKNEKIAENVNASMSMERMPLTSDKKRYSIKASRNYKFGENVGRGW